MKILSIGNSFSTDAQRWIHYISLPNGDVIDTYNLFIGGAPLDLHIDKLKNNAEDYLLEINGEPIRENVSIQEAIALHEYDYITVQQYSGLSGVEESYYPHIKELVDYVKNEQPQAEILLHQTWAYDDDSDHGDFYIYENDRQLMYEKIQETSKSVAEELGLRLIPVGEIIHRLRASEHFSSSKDSDLPLLTRDGYHLHENHGRYAASATWYAFLTWERVGTSVFAPAEGEISQTAWDYIRKTVDEVVFGE